MVDDAAGLVRGRNGALMGTEGGGLVALEKDPFVKRRTRLNFGLVFAVLE
jgi:hypothetical protein